MSRENEEQSVEKTLGSIFKHRREQKGYSLGQLEKMTGISSNYLKRIEINERKAPPIPVMQIIGLALDISIAELLVD